MFGNGALCGVVLATLLFSIDADTVGQVCLSACVSQPALALLCDGWSPAAPLIPYASPVLHRAVPHRARCLCWRRRC
jgi:hypothetical protein